jgi:tetratricopeptide (TPR) repeat protein
MIRRPAAVLALGLAAAAVGQERSVDGDCSQDPAALTREAEDLLSQPERLRQREVVERARQLYRSARRFAPVPARMLRAADLAAADGDFEEAGDLLSGAAETGPELLSPSDWVFLALRAEARGNWREAMGDYESLRSTLASAGERSDWVTPRVEQLEVEIEASGITAPSPLLPLAEARLALAESQHALASGRPREARAKLQLALKLSPSYVEALLALGALETREGRVPQAIRAYRNALKSDPERFEALVALSHLLWSEPDRRAKEEALGLLDRAAALRPDARALVRVSASRWAEWGNAGKALERLDAFRERATGAERRETEGLRETLARRVRGEPEERAEETNTSPEAPTTAALEHWKKAQVYFQRGDLPSIEAALSHLADAERLDPGLARAPELAASIHERRGEWGAAEEARRRAIRADPSRAASYESLALLLARDPRRSAEAEVVWRQADEAGSPEAAFYLGAAALSRGDRSSARNLLERYRNQSPAGAHSEQATRDLASLELRRRTARTIFAVLIALALLGTGVALYFRRGGRTFEEWLVDHPGQAAAARPIVGRLRHEALKHGGLLLADGADHLSSAEPPARSDVAVFLAARLYGTDGSDAPGLVAESASALRDLVALARENGVRLNLRYRDPYFSSVLEGLDALSRAEADVKSAASESRADRSHSRRSARAAARLRAAADAFQAVPGVELDRILNGASDLPVNVESLRALLAQVAAEGRFPPPKLEVLGSDQVGDPDPKLWVRMTPADWETIWRNLFANALAAGRYAGSSPTRLGFAAQGRRDSVTGQSWVRLTLADDAPGRLTSEMIEGRAADRGWGVIVDLVGRHEGMITVGAAQSPAEGFKKGVVLELPGGRFSS